MSGGSFDHNLAGIVDGQVPVWDDVAGELIPGDFPASAVLVDHVTLTATAAQSISAGGEFLTWDTISGAPTERQGFASLASQVALGPVTWITVDRTGWLLVHPHVDFASTITDGTARVIRVDDVRVPYSWPSGTGVWVNEQRWIPVQAGQTVGIEIVHNEASAVDVDNDVLELWLLEDESVGTTYAAIPSMGSASAFLTSPGHLGFGGMALAPNGTLVVLYRAGTDHATSADGEIWKITSEDAGATWSTPVSVLTDASWDWRGVKMTLLSDGGLLASIERRTSASAEGTQGAVVILSDDNGATWSTPVVVTNSLTAVTRGQQVIELDNGDLLCFVYGRNTGDASNRNSVVVSRSTDRGATWANLATVADGPTDGRDYTEAGAALLDDGTIVVVIREEEGKDLWTTTSADDGATWSAPALSLASSYGRPTLEKRPDGDLFSIVRQDGGNLDAQLIQSTDDGATFSVIHTYTEPADGVQMTYGQVVSTVDGLLVMFSYEPVTLSDSDLWFSSEVT